MEQQEQSFSQRKAAQLGEERAQRGEVVPVTPTDLDAHSRETPDEVVESEDVEQDAQGLYASENEVDSELEDSPADLDTELPEGEDQELEDSNTDWEKRYKDLQSETQAIRESRGEMDHEHAAGMADVLKVRFEMEDKLTEAVQRAELMRNVMSGNAQQFKNINWSQVPPDKIQQVQAQAQHAMQMEQQAEQAYDQMTQEVSSVREVTKQREAAIAKTRLQRSIPNWGNDTYGAIRQFATESGMPASEFNEITNPVIIEALYTASQVKGTGSKVRKSTTKKAATPRGKAARRQPRDARGKFDRTKVEPNQRGSFAEKHQHRLNMERNGR